MAAVNVPVKGLTGLITIFAYADDAVTTIADVLASIVAADGITAGYYYNLALVRDTSKDNLTAPTATTAHLPLSVRWRARVLPSPMPWRRTARIGFDPLLRR